ncbi:hypothetical protein [Desulfopila inferna]|uniref:hypothetical protein n=1 Tax=Desulfopila inferna TaxID=468528 RepID=UPI001966B8C0|nr:hypothetical protein [Desulfopila inferna]MBM9603161.1 hypothetical protein [Desulfopila inferna]
MKKEKISGPEEDNLEFRESWTLENAMQVVQHPTVDAKLWAEAVEWLLLYGPEEIKEMLLSASMYATGEQFPDLKATGCTREGELCYDIAEIARALGVEEAEAQRILREKEKSHGTRHGFDVSETTKIQ